MEDFLETRHCTGIKFDFENDQLLLFLKIFILLYADDTVIFGTDLDLFQTNLNVFYEYCQLLKLNVNYKKRMIFGRRNYDGLEFKLGEHVINTCDEFKYLGVVFSKNRSFYKAIKNNIDHAKKAMHILYKRIRILNIPIDLEFKLGEHVINTCDEFKYLGVVFSKNRSFYKAIKNNIDHAKKAMHILYKRIRILNIPIDLEIEIFNHIILSILSYGCEVWGYQNTKFDKKCSKPMS